MNISREIIVGALAGVGFIFVNNIWETYKDTKKAQKVGGSL